MAKWFSFAGAVAAAVTLASPAMAQLTAAGVWDNWQAALKATGLTVSAGAVSKDRGTVTVSDFTSSFTLARGGMTQTIPRIVLATQDDGTVIITMSRDYPVIVSGKSPDGKTREIKLRVRSPDLKITASGTARQTQYDYAASSMAITAKQMVRDGQTLPVAFRAAFRDLTGRYQAGDQNTQVAARFMRAADLSVTLDSSDPDTGKSVSFSSVLRDLSSSGSGRLPGVGLAGDLAGALRSGASTSSRLTHGQATYRAELAGPGSKQSIAATASSGTVSFTLGADGLGYGAQTRDLKLSASGADLPLGDIQLNFASLGFDLEVPVTKTQTPGDFRLSVNITDAEVGDQLWARLDPLAKLPRKPATISIDLSGKVDLLADLFDLTQDSAKDTASPGALRALSLDDLMISAMGATLTANGSVTFDEPGRKIFNGMPLPRGSVSMTLVGAYALIDRLVDLGLVKSRQAMGARMVLGLIARPAGDNDTLNATVEVTKDGSILANGQPLR